MIAAPGRAATPLNIFVYRPGAIGDTILTLPALAALRGRYPGCLLTFAGNPAVLPLLPVEERISADDPRLLPLFRDPPEPLPGYDLYVIFARQLGLPGLQRDPLEALTRGIHVADWLAEAVDPAFRGLVPKLEAGPESWPGLVIHPGAGGVAKRWPAEHFAAVARALGMPLAIVQGPADEAPVSALTAELPKWHKAGCHAAAGSGQGAGGSAPRRQVADPWPLSPRPSFEIWRDLPLASLARRLAGARLFLGNDSGISHLAAAVGAPSVAIYTRTDPGIWGLRGARVRCLAGSEIAPDEVLRICRDLV